MMFIDGDRRIRFWNEAAAQIVGRRFDESPEGVTLSEFEEKVKRTTDESGLPLGTDQRPAMIALETGKPNHGRVYLPRSDGTTSPLEITAFPLFGQSGRTHGAVMIFWSADD